VEQIRARFQKVRDKKLTNLDEGAIQKMIGELETDDDQEHTAAMAQQKAKHRVQARLAYEKKMAAKQGPATPQDLEDEDLSTFVKHNAGPKLKKQS
jgi:BRCT domain type II-containing protein